MRTLVPLLFLASSTAFAQAGRVEGRVMTPDGRPVPKATVRLSPTTVQTTSNVYVEVSSSDGRFLIDNIPAGTYSVTAQRMGYSLPNSPSARPAPVTVTSGETRTVEVKLIQAAVVGGLVLDADGDPLMGVMVRLLRPTYNQGRKMLNPAATATTDDRGQFRMASVQEGRYYVVATVSGGISSGVNEVRGPGARETNQTTYYPSSATLDGAARIEVKAGTVESLQLRMRRGPGFSIKGTVEWPGGPVPTIQVLARGMDTTGTIFSAPVRQGGQFETMPLAPGEYTLLARSSPQPVTPGTQPKLLTGRADVTVGYGNVENVAIRMAEGFELSGRISIEGVTDLASYVAAAMPERPATAAAARAVSVGGLVTIVNPAATPVPAQNSRLPAITLSSAENLPTSVSRIVVNDDGTFRAPNVTPMKYSLLIMNLPPGVYVKSVRMGGQDVMHSFLDLSSGASGPIEIVLSNKAANLTLSLPAAQTQLPQTPVALWPAAPDRTIASGGVRMMILNPQSPGRVQGLAPGDYHAAIFEEGAPQEFANVPEFLARFNAAAAKVTIKEGETGTIEPKVISREAMQKVLSEFP